MDNKSKKRNSNNSYIPLNLYSYSQNNRGNLAPGIVLWILKNRNNILFDNRNNSENSKENFAQQAQLNRNNILLAFRNRRNELRLNNEISRSSLNLFFRNEDRNNNLVNIDNLDLNNYVLNEANRIILNLRNYYQSDEYRLRLNNAGVSLSNLTRLSNLLNSTNRPNISILSSELFRDFHPNSSTIGSTHYRRTTGLSGLTYNPGIYFNRDYLRRLHQYDRIPEYILHETSHWADRLTPDALRYNESLIEGNLRPEVSEYRSNPREIRARGMVVLQNYLNNRNLYRDLDDYLDNSNDNSDALYDLRNNIFRDELSMRNYLNHFVSNDITNLNGYQLYYAKKGGFITSTTYGTTYSDRSKLVSKNSVLRFKQGNKILKFLTGGYAIVGGNKIKTTDLLARKNGWKFISDRDIALDKLRNAGYINENNSWIGSVNLIKPKPNTRSSITTTPRFLSRYANMADTIGGANNIKAWLLKLKNYYAKGTYNPDSIWGANTQAAYERYLADLVKLNVKFNVSDMPDSTEDTAGLENAREISNLLTVPMELNDFALLKSTNYPTAYETTYSNPYVKELFDKVVLRNPVRYIPYYNSNLSYYTPSRFVTFSKEGSKLVSKNPIERFKKINFRIVAQ